MNGTPKQATFEDVQKTANWLQSNTKHIPKLGIVCGTGLGGLADMLEETQIFNYTDIPNFPVSTVAGHAGRLIFGKLSGKSCVCMQGRFHFYEGYPLWKITFPIRVMKLLGVSTLIVTNACGGLNPKYKAGDIMVMKDHINLLGLAGHNPLVGSNDERFGPRFPALSGAYDIELRKLTKSVVEELGHGNLLREGVYLLQGGPSYETIGECRFAAAIGADVVGMSTAPEVTVARHCGIRCLGLSLVTNMCALDFDDVVEANHKEVLDMGNMRAKVVQNVVAKVVEKMEL